MAMIEKIRKQSWLLLVMVGLGIVGFLIPYDAVMAMFGGSNSNIGEIDGHSISAAEWQQAAEMRGKLFTYSNNNSLSDELWAQMVETTLLSDEYEKLGLIVTQEEYDEILFGERLSPYVKSTFYKNQDSLPMKEQLRKTFEAMDAQTYDGYKKLITAKRLKEKYDLLLKTGMYANKLDGKFSYTAGADKVNIEFVAVRYDEIADSLISYSDGDLRSYYNKHKNDRDYRQEMSRSLEYISFPITPTTEDSAEYKKILAELVTIWKGEKSDSLFVTLNSDVPTVYQTSYYPNDLPEPTNSQILNDSIGSFVGPYVDGKFYRMARIQSRGVEVDSVRARHILFKHDGSPAEIAKIKPRVDSVKAVIAKEKNFDVMAKQFGTDGTKDKGGDLDWFTRGRMVKPFENACFNTPVGVVTTVETQFGTHIIEVTDKKAPKMIVRIAPLAREIKPSANTRDAGQADAMDFSTANTDTTSFRKAALERGITVVPAENVKPNQAAVGSLTEAQMLIEWAYRSNTEEGDVSNPMVIADQFIIAALTQIKEKGVPSFENVKEKVRLEVIKEKKGELYKSKMGGENLTLVQIAEQVKSTVKKADNLTMQRTNLPGSGVTKADPEVIGIAFGLPTGNISEPIVGREAVYVIQRTGDLVPGEAKTDYFEDQDKAMQNMKNSAVTRIFNSMKEAADIEDNRYGGN
jgi:peptidyl-prolyl cis-trans isomerase D